MYISCTCNVLIYNVVSVNIKIVNKVFELKKKCPAAKGERLGFESCRVLNSLFSFSKNNKIIL